jgi:hypothetical protein
VVAGISKCFVFFVGVFYIQSISPLMFDIQSIFLVILDIQSIFSEVMFDILLIFSVVAFSSRR